MSTKFKTLISVAVVLAIAVIAYLLLKPAPAPAVGHSAPVGVQGGSLYVWSNLNPVLSGGPVNGYYSQAIVQKAGEGVSSFSVYANLAAYQSSNPPQLTMTIADGSPYTICAYPHNFKAFSANAAGSPLTMVPTNASNPYILKNGAPRPPLPPRLNFQLVHAQADALQYINFNVGSPNTPIPACTATTNLCNSGPLSGSCRLACSTCLVMLDY